MDATRYLVEIKGATPLLMHWDNLDWAETMQKWGLDPANKGTSTRGDDRSPAWRWIGNLYVNAGMAAIPADNLMTVMREGGARCPTGRGKETFKRQTQSGIMVDEFAWPLTIRGTTVPYAAIRALIGNADFEAHQSAVGNLGFSLFVKRAKINQSKHVRVRPRFDVWECQGTLTVFDETITAQVLQDIWSFAGRYCGLGDWRPSSPKSPGSFGKFTAIVKEVRNG